MNSSVCLKPSLILVEKEGNCFEILRTLWKNLLNVVLTYEACVLSFSAGLCDNSDFCVPHIKQGFFGVKHRQSDKYKITDVSVCFVAASCYSFIDPQGNWLSLLAFCLSKS